MDTNPIAGGSQSDAKNPLRLPASATEFYDAVMGSIEPELLSSHLPRIKEFLAYASLPEMKAKSQQYYEALRKCAEALKESKAQMEEHTIALFKFLQNTLEEMSVVSEAKALERLEQSLSAAIPPT